MANRLGSALGNGESWIGRGSAALLRGMGILGVSALSLAAIGVTSGGTLLFSQILGIWPGVNLVAALVVGLVFCLVLAYTYTVISSAVPRAGADYILASRVFGGPLAFVSSWVFVVFCGLVTGTLLGVFIKGILPLFSQIAVLIYGSTGAQELIQVANQPQVIISAGTILTVVAFLGMFVPQRVFQRVLWVSVGLGLVAWVVILASFGSASPGTFEASWDRAHSVENAYATVIPAARALGFQSIFPPDFFTVGSAIGLWVFFGFLSAGCLGGDVRKPESAILRGSGLALVVSAALFIGAFVVVTRIIPADWLAAQSFLSQNPAYTGTATPWITYYAGLIIPSLPLLLVVFWGWVLAFVALIQAYLVWMGRILLAWADDGLLPAGMAYVHPQYRSPLVTVLVAAILVQLGLVFFFADGSGQVQAHFPFFSAVALLVPVTAVTFFPFLRKAWFESSPAFVQRKIGPLPVVTLTGFISLIYLLFLLVSSVLAPGRMAAISLTDLLAFVGMGLSGILWYFGRRKDLHVQGMHLEDVTSSLPRGL